MLPIYFNIIDHYKRKDPGQMDSFILVNMKVVLFLEEFFLKSYICKGKIFILSVLQSYVLNLYHAYLCHSGQDRTEVIIFKHLYWHDLKSSQLLRYFSTFKRVK